MQPEDKSFHQEHHNQNRKLLHSARSKAALILLLAFAGGLAGGTLVLAQAAFAQVLCLR